MSAPARHPLRRSLLLVLVSAGLAFGAVPAKANAPDRQGAFASEGKTHDTVPGSALGAPQNGRPAGTIIGRKI